MHSYGAKLVVLVGLGASISTSCVADCDNNERSTIAIEACSREMTERPPDDKLARLYWIRGFHYRRTKQFESAISDLKRALALDRTSSLQDAYHFELGSDYYGKGQYREAIREYDSAIAISPDSVLYYYERGNGYRADGNLDKALVDYTRAIELSPKYTLAHFARGLVHKGLGQNAEAAGDFEQTIVGEVRHDGSEYEALCIAAQDSARKELVQLRGATSVGAQSPSRPPVTDSGRRIALVIGEANYQNALHLANPEHDAQDVAAAFTRLGFAEVIERHDLTNQQLRDELKSFGDEASEADWAVVYFAGHGIQVDGMTYLVPTDAKLLKSTHAEDEAVSLSSVLTKVEAAHQLRLVILDACRENPFLPHMQVASATRSIGRGLARVEPQSNVYVVYSAKDGQVAQDGDTGHSPFTAALLQHIEEPGTEIDKLFRKVTAEVMRTTNGTQQPFTYGSLGEGDLFFRQTEK